MRKQASLSFLVAVVCLFLSTYVAVQLPVTKMPTETALDYIEEYHLDRIGLNKDELTRLDFRLEQIRVNAQNTQAVHARAWIAGVAGFLAVSLYCFIQSIVLWCNEPKRSNPTDHSRLTETES